MRDKCECLCDFVSCNPDAITMKAKLAANSNYHYSIEAKGVNVTKAFVTDENGFWSIPKSDLPSDFISDGTEFQLTVTKDANDGLPVNMLVAYPVNCINVHVKCIEGEQKAFIGW